MRNDERGSEDLELIHRFRSGEEKAFEVLIEKYFARIYRLASHMLGGSAAAEDMAQEAFIRAYKGRLQFRGDASLYSWLYRITVNLSLNHLSRQRTGSAAGQAAALGSPPPDATEQLELSRRDAHVRNALDALPPHYRVPVMLSILEGLKYREISALLGVPLGTVKSRINVGKHLLRERLLSLLREDLT